MPVRWNLKQWLAVKHHIYRPTELQTLLEEKADTQLSLQAISSLLNNVPSALRLSTIQAICNALNCTLHDFCEILPDQADLKEITHALSDNDFQRNQGSNASLNQSLLPGRSSIDTAIEETVLRILAEQGLLSGRQAATPVHYPSINVLIPSWVWSIIPDLTRGIIETITQSSYNLTLYSLNDNSSESDEQALLDRLLVPPLSAGLVAVFPGPLSSQLTRLSQQAFPVVVIDDQEVHMVPWVEVDNTTGAYIAVKHLLRLGHQRIAHIKGPAGLLASYARYQGYCQALCEAGLLPDPTLILEGDFLPPSGRECARKLFELPPEKRPTAIFAASDQMAYGVLAAAEEYGLSIPEDIALVGFDDDHPSSYTHPPLTTMRQPYFEMGQQSVELLFSLINNAPSLTNQTMHIEKERGPDKAEKAASPLQNPLHIQLQAKLVVRESCGANYRTPVTPSSETSLP